MNKRVEVGVKMLTDVLSHAPSVISHDEIYGPCTMWCPEGYSTRKPYVDLESSFTIAQRRVKLNSLMAIPISSQGR